MQFKKSSSERRKDISTLKQLKTSYIGNRDGQIYDYLLISYIDIIFILRHLLGLYETIIYFSFEQISLSISKSSILCLIKWHCLREIVTEVLVSASDGHIWLKFQLLAIKFQSSFLFITYGLWGPNAQSK